MKGTYKSKELRKMQGIDFRTKNLPITEERSGMEAAGRRIFKENPHIYTEKILKTMYSFIDRAMPGISAEERDLVFYGAVYDYWVYGNSIREEFYYDFIHKTHKEKQQYLTFRSRYIYYAYLNDDNGSLICSDKWKFHNYFKGFFKRDAMLVDENADESTYKEFERFTENNPEFIIKPADLGQGDGIGKISLSDFGGDKRLMFAGVKKKREDIFTQYTWGDSSAVVLEEILVPSVEMKALHPQSTNFVRVSSILADDKDDIYIYHPWLVCGNGGEFFIKGYGNYNLAGINSETGIVETKLCNEYRQFYEYHPDTNVKITGFAIPKWDELIAAVTQMAKMLPTVRYVAWDMALTDKYGWVPIEANHDGEPLWQLCYDKGFKEELEGLIGWKPDDSRFWWEIFE